MLTNFPKGKPHAVASLLGNDIGVENPIVSLVINSFFITNKLTSNKPAIIFVIGSWKRKEKGV